MNKTTDKAVDNTLRKIINDESLKPEERRLLMQYMEELEKTRGDPGKRVTE